ncbi:hypothetical protein MNO14_14415 [Luteimonas sp. S4-F44]|uniref:hypothetical protein n=1 Tax=Luteimonas sp. S4-F44 TaxID=2925842 RepID=UPI001F536A3C|nr:hypothetical protein [Luteimonas sp. S4-F44]UNK42122.1 hypothetical protein MNO14_14415 [Luteimonas sp. S4-F44]
MRIEDIPMIEQEAIRMLLEGSGDLQCALRRQFESILAVQRTQSPAGVYVVFELNGCVEGLEGKPSFHLGDVFARSKNCEEIGFIIFIREGVLEYLEGYCYGDVYPHYSGCDYSIYRQSPG